MSYLELVANLVGRVRRESHDGKTFLVAPAVSIVPGVLSGSKGALYYPPDEIARNVTAWDGTPIVVYHPMQDGLHVSASDPGIYDQQGVGYLRQSRILNGGRLGHELWFDEAKLSAVDNALPSIARILPRLLKGRPIELSTGLFTDNEEAPMNAHFNGRGYTHIARNYRPDHLAILPDQVGACSIRDGCGVLVNKGGPTANVWSDAAREAAKRARQASAKANKHPTPGFNPFRSEADKKKLARMSGDDHLEAAALHKAAARANDAAANAIIHKNTGRLSVEELARVRDHEGQAGTHRTAAKEHKKAARLKGATENSSTTNCACGGTCGKCQAANAADRDERGRFAGGDPALASASKASAYAASASSKSNPDSQSVADAARTSSARAEKASMASFAAAGGHGRAMLSHQNAVASHREASVAAGETGNPDAQSDHLEAMRQHLAAAASHRSRVGVRNADDPQCPT